MYKHTLMSVPLIVMLTACGSDNDDVVDKTTETFNDITFSGVVYNGSMANTTVAIYAGTNLLATVDTDDNGQYSVNASISETDFDQIKDQPVTYHATRNDIILYQYAGISLAEAFASENNKTLISNFSTVEYVLADANNDNYVTKKEWNNYQAVDRDVAELLVVRHGVGLKSVIDHSASMAGFDNSTVWLRALLADANWEEWYTQNITPYQTAWDALFADTWFIDQESYRFRDLPAWQSQYDYVVMPGTVLPVIENMVITGVPSRVRLGDVFTPSVQAVWSNETSTDISALSTFSVSPANALEAVDSQLRVAALGTITLTAEFNGTSTQVTFVSSAEALLESITLTDIGETVAVGDKLSPVVNAVWSDESNTNVTPSVSWTASPADAIVVIDGLPQIVKAGEVELTAHYQGATSSVTFNAAEAVLASLRLASDSTEQFLNDYVSVIAEGVNQNGFALDVSDQVEWVSSNAAVLESLENGQFLAKGVGVATLSASLGEIAAEQVFTVVAKLVNVSINLPNGTISREETVQLSLNAEFNDGSVTAITDEIVWASLNPEYLTIDENGVAVGVLEGTAQVTATYNGVTLEDTIHVIAPRIVSSTPRFEDGMLVVKEGESIGYGFTFTRSNGVQHVFEASADETDFEAYGLRELQDASGIQIAEMDKEADLIHGVRAGQDVLSIDDVPPALQNILVEIGAIDTAYDSKRKVQINVNVLENDDVYQWHRVTAQAPAGDSATMVQAIQSGNVLYRFWTVEGAEQDGLYVTQVTAAGESTPVFVMAASDKELANNQIIHESNGYVLLVTSTDSDNPHSGDTVNYRYNLADGTLTAVNMTGTGYPDDEFNFSSDSFAFSPNGDFVSIRSYSYTNTATAYVYDFATEAWTIKGEMEGARIQTPSNTQKITVLNTKNMDSSSSGYVAPMLSEFDLETHAIVTQELTIPGDAEFYCRSVDTFSLAAADNLRDSAAGCMIARKGSWDGIGYWLWDSVAELPKVHLFTDGVVTSTSDVYGVAARKPDGHVVFSAARIVNGARENVFDVAEIVDVEIEGIIEQRVSYQRFNKNGETLIGNHSPKTRMMDGNQFLIENVNVPNEVFAVFNQGTAIRDEHGVWESNKYMYQLPKKVDNGTKFYHLGDTFIVSPEDHYNADYWFLQLRDPEDEEVVDPVLPEPPVEPTPPLEPTPPVEPAPEV
ncbi:Ig-like domain-containing protein [Photobacterium japonica]|uniref:Ig-like domain-containing protein n=1 Tax=Photobacterium japonica TaxID=2910235 RepID=UPI003D112DDF